MGMGIVELRQVVWAGTLYLWVCTKNVQINFYHYYHSPKEAKNAVDHNIPSRFLLELRQFVCGSGVGTGGATGPPPPQYFRRGGLPPPPNKQA